MGRKNQTYTQAEQRHHLKAQPESGLTSIDYCRQHSVAISTFDNWKRNARNKSTPEFIELPLPVLPTTLEISCGNLSLLVPPSVDFEMVTKLLSAMNKAVS